MKYSVSSYSFERLTSAGKIKETELIAKAKEMGFSGIEFSGINPPEGQDVISYAKDLRAEAEKEGIEIVAYLVGSDILYGGDEIERRLKKDVCIAEALGAKLMRHDVAYGLRKGDRKSFEECLPFLVRGCRNVTYYAKDRGIKTCMENHGYFLQDPARIEQIISKVNNDNFGVLIDIGNFLCCEVKPEYGVSSLLPYAFHIHAKDFIFRDGRNFIPDEGLFPTSLGNFLRGTVIGYGDVPVDKCLKMIKDYGYDGYITVEFEGDEECFTGISRGLKSLKKMLG